MTLLLLLLLLVVLMAVLGGPARYRRRPRHTVVEEITYIGDGIGDDIDEPTIGDDIDERRRPRRIVEY